MWKRGPKVSSVNIGLSSAFREKEAMTAWTKDVHRVIAWQIRQTHWQDWLALAKNVRAATKVCHAVFFVHGMHASIGNNVAVCAFVPSVERPCIGKMESELREKLGLRDALPQSCSGVPAYS